MISTLNISVSALTAQTVEMQAVANNVANISTTGFVPQRVALSDGANGQGVDIQRIVRKTTTGQILLNDTMGTIPREYKDINAEYSKTELSEEIINMVLAEYAFNANSKMVNTIDEAFEQLLDIEI